VFQSVSTNISIKDSYVQPAAQSKTMRPSLSFRCSKSILYTDNLSLYWQSWIWYFWCRWSSALLYHVCSHCS